MTRKTRPTTPDADPVREVARDYKSIRKDYLPDEGEDIFTGDGDRVRLIREIVAGLNQVDQTLIILYAEGGSYRKLGRRLGLSHQTIAEEIRRIKKEILDEYRRRVVDEQNPTIEL